MVTPYITILFFFLPARQQGAYAFSLQRENLSVRSRKICQQCPTCLSRFKYAFLFCQRFLLPLNVVKVACKY